MIRAAVSHQPAGHQEILTSLRRPDGDHLVGFVQPAEALDHHFDVVRGVWFQDGELVAGLVAVRVHDGPLLGADKSEEKKKPKTKVTWTQTTAVDVSSLSNMSTYRTK